ncbi:hypothetical protein [Dyadobacter fermentans]|uniref:Uncharacterized protein n=1 Tax=Dyadobacter fermentans (strain ATCC 700827 / DSM 18053 / CIP 107007 / KCTC 52180 / NS114) TaxID=471854 RepID=C6VRZ7_DYAFD|nr:hypothetical protein [Dyadobacter fermentans]ACT94518.1 hypothetical protein Dfer_3307 [Dyadobacter fermentans DSM 18053]
MAGIQLAYGQVFPETFTSAVCSNCVPLGYSIVSGEPAVSNIVGYQGVQWASAIPFPPSKDEVIFPNTNSVFLSLKSTGTQSAKVKVISGGFVPGFEYTISYYVLTSREQFSSYGSSATLQIATTDQLPAIIATGVTNFNSNNANQWLLQELTFKAPAAELQFTLYGATIGGTGHVNFDIYSRPFKCKIPGGQVKFIRDSDITPFPCETENLYENIKLPIPAGAQVIWKANPEVTSATLTTQQASNASPLPSGQHYYAFYKGENIPYECYNTEFSNAEYSFTSVETQAQLISNSATINCVDKNSFDLTSQKAQSPYEVRWFNNDAHTGSMVSNPTQAPLGTYYAFYYNSDGNCYSTNKALLTSAFTVSPATICCNNPNNPASQIPLSGSTADVACPMQTADLTSFLPQPLNLPPNTVIEWFTTADHSTGKVDDPTAVTTGTYYAFSHDLTYGCYNTILSSSFVNVNTPCAAAELTTTLDIDGLNFKEGTERDFVVNIFETAGFGTNGNTSFRISKVGAFDITFPTNSGTSNVFGGVNNSNGNWAFSEDPNFITASSNMALPANSQTTIGFKIKRKPDKPAGIIQNVTAVIVTSSGGDKNGYNNAAVTAVSTTK